MRTSHPDRGEINSLIKSSVGLRSPVWPLDSFDVCRHFLNVYCNSAAYLVLVLELQMECGAWKQGPGCQRLILRHVALTTPHSLPPEHSVLTERSDTLQYFTSTTHALIKTGTNDICTLHSLIIILHRFLT